MAIACEFINLIIPIKTIEAKYPGGWKQCLKEHKRFIGGKVWYDEHLFRDGAMSPRDMKDLLDWWRDLGFHTHDEDENGKPVKWIDVCVFEVMFGGATLNCDWLAYDEVIKGAYLKGTDIGNCIGRNDVVPPKNT